MRDGVAVVPNELHFGVVRGGLGQQRPQSQDCLVHGASQHVILDLTVTLAQAAEHLGQKVRVRGIALIWGGASDEHLVVRWGRAGKTVELECHGGNRRACLQEPAIHSVLSQDQQLEVGGSPGDETEFRLY